MQKAALFTINFSLCIVICTGCGPKMGKVDGTITFDGKSVPAGTVIFAPVKSGSSAPGRPATGEVNSDGSFQLTTFKQNDGALVGTHRVLYRPPEFEMLEDDDDDDDDSAEEEEKVLTESTNSEFAFLKDTMAPQGFTVEVKSGNNPITIELVKGTGEDGESEAAPTGDLPDDTLQDTPLDIPDEPPTELVPE